jgi:GntR family transcriptional regulator, arabinose operon transcriptional repressor
MVESATQSVKQFSYDRVRQNILEMIRKDHFKPGDRLPSERDLSRRFNLNHQTVRKGLAALVDENIIDRRVGSGTFLRMVPPQGSAVQEKKAPTRTFVGVMALPKVGSFVTEMLGHLHDEAEKRELKINIRTIRDFGAKAQDVIREMVDQGSTSIILPRLPDQAPVYEINELVRTSPVPVVLAYSLPGLEGNCYEKPGTFGKADYKAIEMACRYFHALEYGHIAFFGPDIQYTISLTNRVFAYNQYMSRQGLGTHVGFAGNEAQDVDRIVKGWAPLAGDLAVICYDDDYALRLMTALHKQDFRIPEDVAVLGFNNVPMGKSSDPPLSTIQFDYSYVAGAMLDHARAMEQGQSAQTSGEAREILVIRSSCGGKKRAGEKLDQIIRDVQAEWNPSERKEP